MDIASIRSSKFVIVFRALVALQQRRALGDPGRTWRDGRRTSEWPQPSTVNFRRHCARQ